MARPPRDGRLKRRVITIWQRDRTLRVHEIARRAGASSGYVSKVLADAGRPRGWSLRQQDREIVTVWRRSTASSYNEVARLTGRSRAAVTRALRKIGVNRSVGSRSPAVKAHRILAEWRRNPQLSLPEIARRAGSTREWAWAVLRRGAGGVHG